MEPASEVDPAEAAQVAAAPGRAVAQPEQVGDSTALAIVAGRFRFSAFVRRLLRFYATDLGWTFTHGDDLWVLFGDSWSSRWGTSLQDGADDALGKISLKDFPDGDSVERWVAAHPPRVGSPAWQSLGPPLSISLDDWRRAAPLRPVNDGVPLTSAAGLTPIAGFSNARSDTWAAAFALFLRNEPVQCSPWGTCEHGFDCDPELGRCAPVNDLSAVCVLGTTSCRCVPVGSRTGICQDRGSSMYDPTSERGRSSAAVMRQQVGNALRTNETHFATQPWDTHRFFNATVRTVNQFDPDNPLGPDTDYLPADGDTPLQEGVLVWGRPNFGGVGAEGRDAQLYLAWVPMPEYDRSGWFAWSPRYFAGLDDQGRPRFTEREVDSVPIDLDATTPGEQPEEVNDLVGQMSISWIPSFRRWVMLYGGDMGQEFLELIFGPDQAKLRHDPLGSIYIRWAEHPWGPWTEPRNLLIAGDPENGIVGQYGPGGILHHNNCSLPGCAPSERVFEGSWWRPNARGRLYGPNIIDPWTELRGENLIDLYWHVSTWNPYQVVLMKTRLTAPCDVWHGEQCSPVGPR